MAKNQVTLEAVADYGRRCESIGRERRNTADLQDAMNHPEFKDRHHQLLDELAREYCQSKPITERRTWKTVKLGTYKSNSALRKTLLDADFRIGSWADDILKRIELAKEPSELELIVIYVAELGFSNGATTEKIYEKAISVGLRLCPAEVGPQLRLQYVDQPNGEWLVVAMDPITDSDGGHWQLDKPTFRQHLFKRVRSVYKA